MAFPKITTLNPPYLVELGRIVAHFALLENSVMAAVQGLLKCSTDECRIICCERSFRNLLDLVSSLAKQSLTSQPEVLTSLLLLIDKAQKLEDRRNAFVHSIYGTSPKGAVRSKITAKRKRGLQISHEPITPVTIRSVAMEIAQLAADLEVFLYRHKIGEGWI